MSATTLSSASKPFFFSRKARPFLLVWSGQLVSMCGSLLTTFALGLWVYEQSGSVIQFSLIPISALVPRMLLSPLAGALVDRWDRRRTMLFSDLGAGLATLGIALLLLSGRLETWHILLAAAISSAFGTFQYPAYASSVVSLVPRAELGRANGLIQLAQAGSEIFAPLLAGLLLAAIGTGGVLLIDFATFLFAVLTLSLVRFPGMAFAEHEAQAAARQAHSPGADQARNAHATDSSRPVLLILLQEARDGWRFIGARPGLVSLLGFMGLFHCLWGAVGVLAQPMVLEFASPAGLGALLTVAGTGMLLGSLGMTAWGGPRRKIAGILLFEAVSGGCFLLMGLRPSLALVALGAFGAHATIAVINGSSQALWQSKTPPAMQGRVFAILQMVTSTVRPLAFLSAGLLAERLFEPLMTPGGALAGSLGKVIATGPGRGMGLMFLLMGALKIAVSAAGAAFPRLRYLEDELPDQITEL
jgi:hypothetical protein